MNFGRKFAINALGYVNFGSDLAINKRYECALEIKLVESHICISDKSAIFILLAI